LRNNIDLLPVMMLTVRNVCSLFPQQGAVHPQNNVFLLLLEPCLRVAKF
jgi:hypothetical protein